MEVKRLSKIAREFNVGISTMVEFLQNNGYNDVKFTPNTKIDAETYEVLVTEFAPDLKAKEEKEEVSERRHTKEKQRETVILEEGPHQQVSMKEEKEEEEDTVSNVKTDKPQVKVVDRIDLDEINKPKKPKKAEVEKVEDKEVEKEEDAISEEQPSPEELKEEDIVEEVSADNEGFEPEKAEPVAEEATKKEDSEELSKRDEESKDPKSDDFIPTKANISNNIKVVDKIDLTQINQRTRPVKKTKEERRKEREDREKLKKDSKPAASNKEGEGVYKPSKVKLSGPKVVYKIKLKDEKNKESGKSDDAKPKRKRIKKSNEKVNLDRPNTGPGQRSQRPGQRPNKKGGKRPVRTEVSEADVQKQIKDTLARLTNKGKSKGSKYRRDKRDAVSDKHNAEMERQAAENKVLKITEFVTANELAVMMSVTVNEVISTFMSLGMFVSINQRLDAETISLVAEEFGFGVEFVSVEVSEAIQEEEDKEEDLIDRPPIVTVMGHVDHGKTSLLDYIRSANVIAGEAGGITQHIGAYNVKLSNGRKITFLDTPGHEAFTAMRARGAKVTDIAIVIVAADDDVMPQTIEAINHAKAAEVPIVFAINKIDKTGANPDKIKSALASMDFMVEEWGGKYQSHDISAKAGIGIDELLEKVLLEAELLEVKANPTKKASGSIIESSLDKGRGYVATVLVQNGTLKQGDIVLAGQYHGHVKAMFNERNQRVKTAGPAEPVLILGLNGAPQAGDNFNVMASEKEAREIANKREQLQREQGVRAQKHITLDEIGRRIAIGNFQELNVIVKGDVDGSVEALADSLIKLSTEEIQVNIKHKGVGQISESDIILAAASDAIVIGFQVRPSMAARKIAEKEQIDVRLYSIIYDAIEEIKSAMEGMLSPEIKEEIVSTLEVLTAFKITNVGTIAGCIVREGKINRNNKVRLIRDGIVKYTGELGSLKRFKDNVQEVATGYECGCNIANYNDVKEGDMIEAYKEVEVSRTL